MAADVVEDALERSADAPAARVAIERLEAAHPGLDERLAADEALRRAVVAVVAASPALTVLVETDPEALATLGALDHRAPPPPADAGEDELRRWQRREHLRIAARDLLLVDDVPATGAAVARAARDVLAAACDLAGAGDDLAVIGMGKLGGDELNYSSDIDVMFAGAPDADPQQLDKVAREIMRVARLAFRVDANLRPEGRQGRLVRSVASFEAYWERWAQPWEFQALLKAAPVAGSPAVGADFARAAGEHLWGRAFDADDLRSLRAMKARTEQEVERRGLAARDLKRATGGIRDIEFSVQLLQLVHGRLDPDLRDRGTLVALGELASAGYVDPDDAARLEQAYLLLRRAEHHLQLVDGHQVHTLPADAAARGRLARTLGYRTVPERSALDAFDEHLARERSAVRSIHERLYFRPLLEAFSGTEGSLTPAAVEARLFAFGFREAARTRQAVGELTRGLTRRSRLMQQFLPLILGWLADSPDPDGGLLALRNLASSDQGERELVRSFRESPETARRLCTVLGTSQRLGEGLGRNPDVLIELGDDGALGTRRDRAELLDAVRGQTRRGDRPERARALRRFKEREVLRIGTRDLVTSATVDQTAVDLTALAEATIEGAVDVIAPSLPLAVIAVGRLGGAELSYASDLDLVFVYDGEGPGAFAEAERAAAALVRLLDGDTPAHRIYEVDTDLRPEGRQGPLTHNLEGYRAYFERWAQTWERQAMVRARPIAGDRDLGRRLMEALHPFVWGGLTGEEIREIRRMKARIERERIPAGQDPQFHFKLGRGSLSDVEFTAQLLQLQHRVPATGTTAALRRLTDAGVLAPDDADVLASAYRFCERTRNRLSLITGGRADALPQHAEQLARLARSLETTPVELRERYRRVTRRSRAVVERVFYGKDASPP